MNNDPTPSSSAARQPQQRHEDIGDNERGLDDDLDHDPEVSGLDRAENSAAAAARLEVRPEAEQDGDDARPGTPPPDPEVVARNEKRRSGLARKMKYLVHLSKSLDSVFMAELCMLYYMECSLPRLLLRFIPHALFLLPRADSFLLSIPAQRAHVFAIFVPNTICLLLHLLCSLPRASEATRGYLHGGIIIDFIGQKPPTSKLAFVLLDLLILVVQCIMLAVDQERHVVKRLMAKTANRRKRNNTNATQTNEESGSGGSNEATMPTLAAPSTQDHDAEERGILRDAPSIMVGSEDIELQPLYDRSGAAEGERTEEDDHCDNLVRRSEAADLTDVLRSGNAILADLHVIHILRTAGNSYHNPAAAYSIQRLSYMATLATMTAENRLRAEANRRP